MEYFLSVIKRVMRISPASSATTARSQSKKNCNQMVEANVQSQNWSHRRERSGFGLQAQTSVQTNCCSHTHSSHSSCSPFCCESLQPAPLSDYTNAQENLFFCSSTPDGPFYSVWDWSINPTVVMSLQFNKTAPFRSPVHFKRYRTWIRTWTEVL